MNDLIPVSLTLIILALLVGLYLQYTKRSTGILLSTGSNRQKLILHVLLFLPLGILFLWGSYFLLGLAEHTIRYAPYVFFINLIVAIFGLRLALRNRKLVEWHMLLVLIDICIIGLYLFYFTLVLLFMK